MKAISFKADQQPQLRFAPVGAPYQQNPVGIDTQQPPRPQARPNVVVLPMDSFNRQGLQAQQKKKFNWDSFYKFMGLATSLALTALIALSLKPMWGGLFKKTNPEELFTPLKDNIVELSKLPGMDEVKNIFKRKVVNPAKYPELFENEGLEPGVMMLLTGSQGVGKTNFVFSAAKEVGARVATIKLSEEGSTFVNGTSLNMGNKVKNIIYYCKKNPNEEVFLLLDEIEAILSKGAQTGDEKLKDIKTILQILDDAKSVKNLRIFATTNEMVNPQTGAIGNLDRNAVGRFLSVYIKKPDLAARKSAIKMYFMEHKSCKAFAENEALVEEFALRTENYSYRDIVQIKDRAVEKLMELKIEAKEAGRNPDEVILTRDIVMEGLREFAKTNDNGRVFVDDLAEILGRTNSGNTVEKTGFFARIKKFFSRKPATTEG